MKGFCGSGLRSVLIWMSIAVCGTMYGQTVTRQTAMQLEQQGKNAEAEQAWRSIAKANPRNAEAYAHMGLLEARQEHYEAAIALYRKALALNPAFPALQLNMGLALFKTGKFQEAIQCFQVELKKHPGDQMRRSPRPAGRSVTPLHRTPLGARGRDLRARRRQRHARGQRVSGTAR